MKGRKLFTFMTDEEDRKNLAELAKRMRGSQSQAIRSVVAEAVAALREREASHGLGKTR